MTGTGPRDDDRWLATVFAVPLALLTLVSAYFCWTALTVRPSGAWDDDAYAGIVLACVMSARGRRGGGGGVGGAVGAARAGVGVGGAGPGAGGGRGGAVGDREMRGISLARWGGRGLASGA
ncbi:hypothetical protein GCM10017776_27170 [Streptomyces griseoluteus]|nr:hypothetical protein GCM10017776_27170 [Streptomyces griseoluteus]